MKRKPLDRGEKSCHIRSQVIAPAFNDPRFRPTVDFDDYVQNIDRLSTPTVNRDGRVLQLQLKAFEKELYGIADTKLVANMIRTLPRIWNATAWILPLLLVSVYLLRLLSGTLVLIMKMLV